MDASVLGLLKPKARTLEPAKQTAHTFHLLLVFLLASLKLVIGTSVD